MCLALLLLPLIPMLTDPASAAQPGPPAAALKSAGRWLDLLDADRYAESWELAGMEFRQSLGKTEWAKRMAKVRRELGANMDRRLIDARQVEPADPDGPRGECLAILFGATYEKVSYTTETLTLCRGGGLWRVVGYFIR